MTWLGFSAVRCGHDPAAVAAPACLLLGLLFGCERPPEVVPGEEVEGELAARETLELRLSVPGTRFVELTVTPVGKTGPARPLRVRIVGPDRRTVTEATAVASFPGDRFVWISVGRGEYRVLLSAAEPLIPTQYRLRLGTREVRHGDGWRLEALRAESASARRFSRQEFEPAIAELEEACRCWHLAGEREAEIEALFALAVIDEDVQRVERAFARYDQARRLAQDAEDWGLVAEEMFRRGRLLVRLKEMERAAEVYQKARILAERVGDDRRVAAIAYNQATVLRKQGNLDAAWSGLIEAEELARTADDSLTEAYAMLLRSKILRARYEVGAACDLALRALAVGARVDHEAEARQAQAAIHHELGNLFQQQGDLAAALAHFEASVRLFRAEGQWPSVAGTLRSLAVLAQAMRDSRAAQRYATEALEVAEALGDRAEIAKCLRELGAVLSWRGENEQAEALYQRALEVLPREADRLRGSVLHRLGVLELARGRIDQAVEKLRLAADLRQRASDRDGLALTRLQLGVALTRAGRLDEARRQLLDTLDYYRRRESPNQIAICQYYIAEVEFAAGRLEPARAAIEETLALGRDLRARLTTDRMRIEFFSRVRPFYDFYLDLLMHLAAQRPGDGYEELAFRASEEARARGLLDLLFEADADLRGGIEPDLERRGREIERRLTFLQGQLSDALARDPASRRHLRQLYEETEEEWAQVERSLQALSPSYRTLRAAQPLELKQVQSLLGPDRALIEYWVGERGSYVFAVTDDILEIRELPPRNEIEQRVSTFRNGVLRILPRDTFEAEARWLFDELLAPVGAIIQDRTHWIVVPDGPLQVLPFEALPVRQQNGREAHLVETRAVSYAPSATVLALLVREAPPAPADANARFVVFADPALEADAVVPCPGEDGSGENGVLDLAADTAALSASRSEAEGLAALHGEGSRVFVGRAATEAAVKRDPAVRSATRLHFATHGLICKSRPERSALVFAGTADGEDGLLQLREVFDLELAADLVVLSACETGLGRNLKGEGIVGLARGFLHAGAGSVVVSLWKVADRSTAELMLDFYQELENAGPGADKAEALRAAKRAMIANGGEWAHPYHWAPFILIGDRETVPSL